MMIFWAGLRGAVGVALAMGFSGEAKWTLLATVLVVVVLTVILFGGTTASMLEILGIKIGCVDESGDFLDDEFDIEAPPRFPQQLQQSNISSVANKNQNIYGNRRFARSSKLSNYKDNLSAVNLLDQEHGGVPNTGNSSTSNFANVNDDDDDDEIVGSDVDDFISGSISNSTSNINNNNDRGGVLGAILSAEEHAKWFTRFDEEVLKPVLLDTLPSTGQSSQNNSTSNLNSSGNGNGKRNQN